MISKELLLEGMSKSWILPAEDLNLNGKRLLKYKWKTTDTTAMVRIYQWQKPAPE